MTPGDERVVYNVRRLRPVIGYDEADVAIGEELRGVRLDPGVEPPRLNELAQPRGALPRDRLDGLQRRPAHGPSVSRSAHAKQRSKSASRAPPPPRDRAAPRRSAIPHLAWDHGGHGSRPCFALGAGARVRGDMPPAARGPTSVELADQVGGGEVRDGRIGRDQQVAAGVLAHDAGHGWQQTQAYSRAPRVWVQALDSIRPNARPGSSRWPGCSDRGWV